MTDSSCGVWDLYMNMLAVLVLLWIVFSIIFYVYGNPNQAQQLLIVTQPGQQQPPISRDHHIQASISSTPVRSDHEQNRIDALMPEPAVTATSSSGRSCNPGQITNNAWFNFLRTFRTSNCGIRQNELCHRAAAVWRNMTDAEKEPYRQQAEHMKSMSD